LYYCCFGRHSFSTGYPLIVVISCRFIKTNDARDLEEHQFGKGEGTIRKGMLICKHPLLFFYLLSFSISSCRPSSCFSRPTLRVVAYLFYIPVVYTINELYVTT
jgi:hypothetical protein